MSAIVKLIDGTPATTTLVIAEGVGHGHKSVIKLVREHRADLEQFGFLSFQIAENRGTQGPPTEYAILNEQQTSLLLTYMRNSEVVKQFKIRLVKEFYAMRDRLREIPQQSMPVVKNPTMQLVIAQALEIDRLDQEQKQLAARLDAVEDRVATQDSMFYTVLGYARKVGTFIDNVRASVLGRAATRLSKEREYPMGEATDPRYGVVHTYHVDILQEVFG